MNDATALKTDLPPAVKQFGSRPLSETKTYAFDGFIVTPTARTIMNQHGEEIELRPRVFDTLLALLAKPGATISKTDLITAVWPNSIVEENNLNQAISSLRKVLKQHSGGKEFIVTRPGRGYQFVADVSENQNTLSEQVPTPPPTAGVRMSLAVLPFETFTTDSNLAPLADGLTDGLTTALNDFIEFDVQARSTMFSYKGRSPNIRALGRELGVNYVLDGSLQLAGETLRVSAQLVDARTGTSIWSQKFDRSAKDPLAAQDEVIRAVLLELHPTILHFEKELTFSQRAADLSALELFRQASHPQQDRANIEQLDHALSLYDLALKKDPNLATAHAEKAMWVLVRHRLNKTASDQEVDDRVKFHVSRAVALEPKNATVLVTAAICHSMIGEHQKASPLAQRAAALQPNQPFVSATAIATKMFLTGTFVPYINQIDDLIGTLSAHNPVRLPVAMYALMARSMMEEYQVALDIFETNIGFRENYPESLPYAAICYEQVGNSTAADEALSSIIAGFPSFEADLFCRRNIALWIGHPNHSEGLARLSATLVAIESRIRAK